MIINVQGMKKSRSSDDLYIKKDEPPSIRRKDKRGNDKTPKTEGIIIKI
jgi:hypothetical protein